MKDFWKGLFGFLTGEAAAHAVDNLKARFEHTMEDLEKRVEKATIKVIKTSVIFIMIFIGVVFMLVGAANFLNETVPRLANGLGTVLIGATLVFIALLVRLLK